MKWAREICSIGGDEAGEIGDQKGTFYAGLIPSAKMQLVFDLFVVVILAWEEFFIF